ncbi:MAG: addiction module protein [Candidatus Desantisbacteria bacterium]
MSLVLQEVVSKAFDLPLKERAELAHGLIVSIDDAIGEEVETAWDAEIGRRVMEIKNGTAKGRLAKDILAEIRAKYS